jgi:hypothetical protein
MREQLQMWQPGRGGSGWRNLYTRDRKNGVRLSVSVPPSGDVVIVKVGDRTVALQRDELANVERAIRAAREGDP